MNHTKNKIPFMLPGAIRKSVVHDAVTKNDEGNVTRAFHKMVRSNLITITTKTDLIILIANKIPQPKTELMEELTQACFTIVPTVDKKRVNKNRLYNKRM